MSIAAGLIDPEMNHKKSFHRRNDSDELDVFEAAKYFSGYNEVIGYNINGSTTFTQKIMRSEERQGGHRGGRISLDMPMRTLLHPQQFHQTSVDQKQMMNIKEKKHNKQPSSPGGRLASFLNSLFSSQSASSKKKKSKSSQSMKDNEDEISPGGRRRRRSSISHFRSSSSADTSKSSIYSSSSLSSGFRTPPYVVQTPTKSCKEFKALSTKYNGNGHVKSTTLLQNELWEDHKKKRSETTLLDDNYNIKQSNVGLSEKEIKKFNEVDDGAESDSSSDLFELQNYDLGYCSSGLPVYETTHMDNIKRGAPISNGPM